MTSALGMAELPLTILLWIVAGLMSVGVVFAVIIAVLAAIAEYADQKQKIKWDEMVRGIRK